MLIKAELATMGAILLVISYYLLRYFRFHIKSSSKCAKIVPDQETQQKVLICNSVDVKAALIDCGRFWGMFRH